MARRGNAADFAALVDEPLPRAGSGADSSLDFFFSRVAPGMSKLDHPRFHAFIPRRSSFYAALGKLLDAGTNPFVGSWLGGATVASLELTRAALDRGGGRLRPERRPASSPAAGRSRTCARWLRRGASAAPSDVAPDHGSSTSRSRATARSRRRRSISATRRARYAAFRSTNASGCASTLWPRRSSGPPHGRRALLVSRQRRHHQHRLHRSAARGRRSVRRARDLWFHVDAAYGGFAALCDEGRRKLAGMERADSLTLDPHKWLYAPMGTGCVLVRDRAALEGAFRVHGDYLKDVPRDEVNFFDRGPEMSRPGPRARGVDAAALGRPRRAGRAGGVGPSPGAPRRAAVERGAGARDRLPHRALGGDLPQPRAAGETEAARAARDTAIMERTLASGELMISSTDLAGRSALRLVVLNHRTTEDEVRRSVAAIARAAGEI